MPDPLPTQKSTLAIILGASEFPKASLTANKAFLHSAQAFQQYLMDRQGLNLPTANVINLFNLDEPAPRINELVVNFLKSRQETTNFGNEKITDVIVYYVGHGSFSAPGNEYYLAIRDTTSDNEYYSSYPIKMLANALRKFAPRLRKFLILDSCFAGAAQFDFQGGTFVEVVTRKTLQEFPTKGTALLCAAGSRDPAKAPRNQDYTMFSGALFDVLKSGSLEKNEVLTLADIGDLVRSRIEERFPDQAVRPELHCPDQAEGKICDLPLFPNPARFTEKLESPDEVQRTFVEARDEQVVRGNRNVKLKKARIVILALLLVGTLCCIKIILPEKKQSSLVAVVGTAGNADKPQIGDSKPQPLPVVTTDKNQVEVPTNTSTKLPEVEPKPPVGPAKTDIATAENAEKSQIENFRSQPLPIVTTNTNQVDTLAGTWIGKFKITAYVPRELGSSPQLKISTNAEDMRRLASVFWKIGDSPSDHEWQFDVSTSLDSVNEIPATISQQGVIKWQRKYNEEPNTLEKFADSPMGYGNELWTMSLLSNGTVRIDYSFYCWHGMGLLRTQKDCEFCGTGIFTRK